MKLGSLERLEEGGMFTTSTDKFWLDLSAYIWDNANLVLLLLSLSKWGGRKSFGTRGLGCSLLELLLLENRLEEISGA